MPNTKPGNPIEFLDIKAMINFLPSRPIIEIGYVEGALRAQLEEIKWCDSLPHIIEFDDSIVWNIHKEIWKPSHEDSHEIVVELMEGLTLASEVEDQHITFLLFPGYEAETRYTIYFPGVEPSFEPRKSEEFQYLRMPRWRSN